jgi:hypothetical protein
VASRSSPTAATAWIGWVQLKTDRVDEVAIGNTARVIRDLNADVLNVVEADNRIALKQSAPRADLPRVMVIDGNDDRGIDVGVLAKTGFPIGSAATSMTPTPKEKCSAATAPSTRSTCPAGSISSFWSSTSRASSVRTRRTRGGTGGRCGPPRSTPGS